MDRKMEPKCQRPAEPAAHPPQGRAHLHRAGLWGAGLLECTCRLSRACKGCCRPCRVCFLPGKMPAMRKEKKYTSDKIL